MLKQQKDFVHCFMKYIKMFKDTIKQQRVCP